jgi:hypothetical protein
MHEAMRMARSGIADTPNGIRTWGAYQHYGNPYFRFFYPTRSSGKAASAGGYGPSPAAKKKQPNSTKARKRGKR